MDCPVCPSLPASHPAIQPSSHPSHGHCQSSQVNGRPTPSALILVLTTVFQGWSLENPVPCALVPRQVSAVDRAGPASCMSAHFCVSMQSNQENGRGDWAGEGRERKGTKRNETKQNRRRREQILPMFPYPCLAVTTGLTCRMSMLNGHGHPVRPLSSSRARHPSRLELENASASASVCVCVCVCACVCACACIHLDYLRLRRLQSASASATAVPLSCPGGVRSCPRIPRALPADVSLSPAWWWDTQRTDCITTYLDRSCLVQCCMYTTCSSCASAPSPASPASASACACACAIGLYGTLAPRTFHLALLPHSAQLQLPATAPDPINRT